MTLFLIPCNFFGNYRFTMLQLLSVVLHVNFNHLWQYSIPKMLGCKIYQTLFQLLLCISSKFQSPMTIYEKWFTRSVIRACSLVLQTTPRNMTISSLVHTLDLRVELNRYCIVGRVQKALLEHNNLGILWSNFHLLYKRVNYQYLIIFDQIKS